MIKSNTICVLFFGIVFLLQSHRVLGNIHFIEYNKIVGLEKIQDDIDFLFDNEPYIINRLTTWTHEVSKRMLIRKLTDIHTGILKLKTEGSEKYLLLGDVAHFLVNLGQDKYFPRSVNYYKRAIHLNSDDYRGYWFLATHYAKLGLADSAFVYYAQGEDLLPAAPPALFWEEYAGVLHELSLPSHLLFVLNKLPDNYLADHPSINEFLTDKFSIPDPDSAYTASQLWSSFQGETPVYYSRPFGMRFTPDTSFQVAFSDYSDYVAYLSMSPSDSVHTSAVSNYAVSMTFHPVPAHVEIDEFAHLLTADFSETENIELPVPFKKSKAYKLFREAGAHQKYNRYGLLLVIRRDEPAFPGKILEYPGMKGKNHPAIVRASAGKIMGRFQGPVMYTIMLESQHPITEELKQKYLQFINHQICLE